MMDANISFAYPMVLFGLLLLPLLAIWRFWPNFRDRQRGTFLFSQFDLLAEQGTSWKVRLLPLLDLMVLISLACGIVALARPQTSSAEEVEVEGIDIYLALDMSGSMRAIDLTEKEIRPILNRGKTPPNRFDSAVFTLKEFVGSRNYDRIGMVVFAEDAYLQFPLTLDYNTITEMLDRLKLGDISENGTAIGNALGRALAGLKESDARSKIIILITDGDRRGGNISPMSAAQIATKEDIKIFPILVGREGAALVPVGRNLFTNQISYQHREFPINPDLLKQIATQTGGEYFRVQDADGLKKGLHDILDRFERSRITDASNVEYQERYHDWLWWAIALLAMQFVLRYSLFRKFP